MFNEPFGLQQATFDGIKTMTRRIVPQVILDYAPQYQQEYYEQTLSTISFEDAIINMVGAEKMFQRYVYQIGEIVAIAQAYKNICQFDCVPTWVPTSKDPSGFIQWDESKGYSNKMFVKAEHMPHHIKIIDRRLERLQDISDEDCLREGIQIENNRSDYKYGFYTGSYMKTRGRQGTRSVWYKTPREAYADLIDRVSGKGTWYSNPLVFAYEYKRID